MIATRLGGVVDSVIHERTGLLVDEQAPQQIAQAAQRLVHDPALASRLTGEAYSHAVENFSRGTSAARFSELFAALSGSREAPAA